MWYVLGLILLSPSCSQVIVTFTSQGEVHYSPDTGTPLYPLLTNLTSPQSAVGDPKLSLVYICSQGNILQFQVDFYNPRNHSSGQTVYTGGNAVGLALDLWGNLFFVDQEKDWVGVVYAQWGGGVKVLYNNSLEVDKPVTIAVDDFSADIYWGNSGDANPGIRKGAAFPTPPDSGLNQVWPDYRSTPIDGLAVTHNRVFISTVDSVRYATKRFPQNWTSLGSVPGKVLSGAGKWAYVQNRETGEIVKVSETEESQAGEVVWNYTEAVSLSIVTLSTGKYIAGITVLLGAL